MTQSNLEQYLSANQSDAPTWSRPIEYDFSSLTDRQHAEQQFQFGEITNVVDKVDEIANDVFEITLPSDKEDIESRSSFVKGIHEQGLEYGRWFYFPWSKSLVRYADQSTHQELRTFRNKELITAEEQKKLLGSTAVVFGLSVGSSVAEQLILNGITGSIVLGDPDVLSPSNLNRVKAGMPEVGMKKLDVVACRISETDPYINQTHFRDGATTESLNELKGLGPNIIFDEVDDLSIKAMLRLFAAKQKIPLVMATDVGDKSIIDIERHDLEETIPFAGRLSRQEFDDMLAGSLTDRHKQKIMTKIIGLRHVSPRMLDSVMKIGDTLTGMPQLGTTASAGGVIGAVAAREILTGTKLSSGRYIHSPRRTLRLQSQTGVRDTVDIFNRFIQKSKAPGR